MSSHYRMAHDLGTAYAAHGIAWEQLRAELERDGVAKRTIRLAKRFYNEQTARG